MAKDKKKRKKHQSFYKAIKPIIQDDRVLYAILGAVGVGLILGSALSTEKREALADKITTAVKGFGQQKTFAGQEVKPVKQVKPAKPTKLAKSAALKTS